MKHQREGEAVKWFWNYHCQNQGGMCYRHKLIELINGPQASWLEARIKEGLRIGSCVSIWAVQAMYL